MKLGKASAYAVFATAYIAANQEAGPVPGRDVAASCGIPAEYLLKVLQQLVRSRVLKSERGRAGGFLLREPASQTTLLQVLEGVEGPLGVELSVTPDMKVPPATIRRVQSVIEEINASIKSALSRTTVADFIEHRRAQ